VRWVLNFAGLGFSVDVGRRKLKTFATSGPDWKQVCLADWVPFFRHGPRVRDGVPAGGLLGEGVSGWPRAARGCLCDH